MNLGGFPGGSVVNKPIANAGDAGSIPAPGRSYVLWSNKAHVPQPLSLCSGAQEPQLLCTLEPELCNKRHHCNEKPVHHNYRVVLRSPLLEKSLCDSKDPAQPKNKQTKIIYLKRMNLMVCELQFNKIFLFKKKRPIKGGGKGT